MKLSSKVIGFGIVGWMVLNASTRLAFADSWKDRTWLGGRVGLGFQNLTTDLVTNTPKSGYNLNFLGIGEYRTDHFGFFGLELGLNRAALTGQTSARIQELAIHSLMADVYYLYPLFPDLLGIGLVFSSTTSAGARMDFRDLTSLQSLLKVGPKVRLTWSKGEAIEWYAEGDFLYSLNSASKSIWALTGAAGVLFRFGDAPKKEEPVVAAAPTPEPAPAPAVVEEAPKVAVQLDAKLVTFDVNKTTIKPKSLDFLKKISALLLAQESNWKTIEVSGHTDGTGKASHNLTLSRGRAKAVMDEMIKNGIPADRVTSVGYGATRMIAGEAKNSHVHRRVELAFGGVADAQKLQDALNSLKGQQKESSGENE